MKSGRKAVISVPVVYSAKSLKPGMTPVGEPTGAAM